MKQPSLTLSQLSQSPRCGARMRAGEPCQALPVHGRNRCRLHGGLSPGAPKGEKNGNYTDGDWTAEAIAERKWLRELIKTFANVGDLKRPWPFRWPAHTP
jgi:hypothetical protein